MHDRPLPVPASEADLTPDWLSLALATPVGSCRAERIRIEYGYASTLFRLVCASSTHPPSIVAKLWSTADPDGDREVRFYRDLAPRLGGLVPKVYFAASDAARGRAALLLEDLCDARPGDCLETLRGDEAVGLAVAAASLHAAWWRKVAAGSLPWLSTASQPHDTGWLRERRAEFLARHGDCLDPRGRRVLASIEGVDARAHERLAGAAETVIHGDLHLDNVLFAPRGPVLVDWSRAARGPAVCDLAAILFSATMPEDWDRVLEAVRIAWPRGGVPAEDLDRLPAQLGGALLLRFVSATCGMARWDAGTPRQKRIIAVEAARTVRAIESWAARDPDLLRF